MYTILTDYYSMEFNFELHKGDVLYNGDIEPDLIANLVVAKVLLSERVAPFDGSHLHDEVEVIVDEVEVIVDEDEQ